LKKRSLVSWLSAAILISLALPGHGSTRALTAPAGPKTLHGHIPDVVAQGRAQTLGHHPGNDRITLAVGLPLRDAALDAFLPNLNDPSSPGYHQFLTQAQANQFFNPTSRQESEVVKWLQSHGLTVTQTYSNHLLVDASGTCGYDYCNDQIYQTVTLPIAFSKVTLGYWYYSDTQEAAGSPCYDYFYSRLRTSTGTTITTPQQSCNSSVTNGWVYKSFDVTSSLSSYAGKQVQVYFQGTTDVWLISDFFVDDVTLNVS
jgi:hypothetical protein